MKKVILLSLLSVLLIFTLVGAPVLAKDPDKGSQGGPFEELWDAIDDAVSAMEQMVGDAISALQEQIDDIQSQIGNTEMPILGAWQSREPYEKYDADTDGFVVASLEVDSGSVCDELIVEVWDLDDTIHKIVEYGSLGSGLSITVPVPKGYSWRISTGSFPICNPTIYWVSLGN